MEILPDSSRVEILPDSPRESLSLPSAEQLVSSLGLGGIFIHLYKQTFVKELWYILAIQALRRLRLEDC